MTEPTVWKVGPYEEWGNNKMFGELLAYWRQMKNLSRKEAARRLDLSSEYIRLIEHGLRIPAEAHMHHILELYDVQYTRVEGRWVIGTNAFEFTSRIKAARNEPLPPPLIRSKTRHELLGALLEVLSRSNKDDLIKTYEFVMDSRENHDV